jgi:hypothetical protein
MKKNGRTGAESGESKLLVTPPKRTRGKKTNEAPVSAKTDDVVHSAMLNTELAAIDTALDQNTRRQLIAESAYYRALRRGFANGSPESDWLEAEAELDARIAKTDQST